MFDEIRHAFRELLRGNPSPDARRSILSDMRETLVRAKMGLDDLRQGIAATQKRVTHERTELETIRRRKALAEGINDVETVRVAERYEAVQSEKVAILERKLETQQAELEITEREVQEMTAEFKAAASGAVPPGPSRSADSTAQQEVDDIAGDGALKEELDTMARQARRANVDADAEDKLAALKRRMGKQP